MIIINYAAQETWYSNLSTSLSSESYTYIIIIMAVVIICLIFGNYFFFNILENQNPISINDYILSFGCFILLSAALLITDFFINAKMIKQQILTSEQTVDISPIYTSMQNNLKDNSDKITKLKSPIANQNNTNVNNLNEILQITQDNIKYFIDLTTTSLNKDIEKLSTTNDDLNSVINDFKYNSVEYYLQQIITILYTLIDKNQLLKQAILTYENSDYKDNYIYMLINQLITNNIYLSNLGIWARQVLVIVNNLLALDHYITIQQNQNLTEQKSEYSYNIKINSKNLITTLISFSKNGFINLLINFNVEKNEFNDKVFVFNNSTSSDGNFITGACVLKSGFDNLKFTKDGFSTQISTNDNKLNDTLFDIILISNEGIFILEFKGFFLNRISEIKVISKNQLVNNSGVFQHKIYQNNLFQRIKNSTDYIAANIDFSNNYLTLVEVYEYFLKDFEINNKFYSKSLNNNYILQYTLNFLKHIEIAIYATNFLNNNDFYIGSNYNLPIGLNNFFSALGVLNQNNLLVNLAELYNGNKLIYKDKIYINQPLIKLLLQSIESSFSEI